LPVANALPLLGPTRQRVRESRLSVRCFTLYPGLLTLYIYPKEKLMETQRKRRAPRHFLYLDHEIAESYLSDLIGWVPEEGSATDRFGENSRRSWNVGYRGTGYGRGSGEDSGSEDTEKFRYTPAAIFDRLHRELDEVVDGEKMIIPLQSLDDEGWRDLQNGDILEITGMVGLPDIARAISAMQGLGGMMPIFKRLQETGEIPSDSESQMVMGILETMTEVGESAESKNAAVVVVELAATPEYRFVANLKREFLRVGVEDLMGEVKVLGKVQRKINEGDPPIGLEGLVPGFEAFKALQEMSSDSEPPDESITIGYPAATLIPIGIWQ
jgi:hypothetical protein